jgi:hypothetical protein
MPPPPARPSDGSADAGREARVAAPGSARRQAARPAARRLTLISVAAALTTTGVATIAITLLLHQPFTSGLLDFGVFGSLAAITAGVLAWESASNRCCPRCRYENRRHAAACEGCGYDLAARPRFACSEGHRVSYEPGMCDCGRRLLALRAPQVGRHAINSVVLALATFLAVLVVAQLIAHAN